jgi:hypothetical protein
MSGDPGGWRTETGLEGEVGRIEADANAPNVVGAVVDVAKAIIATVEGEAPEAPPEPDAAADAVDRAIAEGRRKAGV